jgi:thioredoxin reductase
LVEGVEPASLDRMSHSESFDVVIVGGGAAGLSAALVLSRARRRVLVIDSGTPRNAPAAHMHGFLSRDGHSPAELLESGSAEVRRYGGQIVRDRVTGATRVGDDHLILTTRSGKAFAARRALVTTGLIDELPDIGGLRERWGRDVLHCPYCHGWEVRDQRLAVISDGSAEHIRYAQIVRQWAADLVLFAPAQLLSEAQREELLARAIGVVEGSVSHVVTDAHDHLSGVALDDGRVIARDAVFVPPRFAPNSALLSLLACDLDSDGWPLTTGPGRTTVREVFVAGNVTNPRAQVITAAGEGSAAAIALNADLVDLDVALALQQFRQPVLHTT